MRREKRIAKVAMARKLAVLDVAKQLAIFAVG
jgi:hypothetical protein